LALSGWVASLLLRPVAELQDCLVTIFHFSINGRCVIFASDDYYSAMRQIWFFKVICN
jgi:hypothetical protein